MWSNEISFGVKRKIISKCNSVKQNYYLKNCKRRPHWIKWWDKIPDTEVLRRATAYSLLNQSQFRWLTTWPACLTIDYQRNVSMKPGKTVRKIAWKTLWNHVWRKLTLHQIRVWMLCWTPVLGMASSEIMLGIWTDDNWWSWDKEREQCKNSNIQIYRERKKIKRGQRHFLQCSSSVQTVIQRDKQTHAQPVLLNPVTTFPPH